MNAQRTCILSLLLASLASIAHSQVAVAPPPRPSDAAPSRDSGTEALQAELSRLPRVDWQETITTAATNVTSAPAANWEQVASVRIGAPACKATLAWNDASTNNAAVAGDYFLELFEGASVLPSDQLASLWHPGFQYAMTPAPYSAYMKLRGQNNGFDFKVTDRGTAERIAASFRQLIGKCADVVPKSVPGPSLKETLNYLRDQLTSLSTISSLVTRSDLVANTSGTPLPYTLQISQVTANPSACVIAYQQKSTFGSGAGALAEVYWSMRRISKLTVLSAEAWDKSMFAKQGHPEDVNAYSIPLSVVVINGEMGTTVLTVPDQDTGDHIAKALLHAVELCGGGSKSLF